MRVVYFYIIGFLFFGCAPNEMSVDLLKEYVSDANNGLIKNIQRTNGDVIVTYKPSEVFVHQELQGGLDTVLVDSLKSIFSDNIYFEVKCCGQYLKDKEVATNLNVNSLGLGQKVKLKLDDKDLKLLDFHVNTLVGFSDCISCLFAFEREEFVKTDVLTLSVKEWGLGIGEVETTFEVQDIVNIPNVNFYSK